MRSMLGYLIFVGGFVVVLDLGRAGGFVGIGLRRGLGSVVKITRAAARCSGAVVPVIPGSIKSG